MPFGSFINVLPPAVFIVIHLALLIAGVWLAARSNREGLDGFATGFGLWAGAEAVYVTYHLDVTVILFAHTVAEVLNALAFVTLFLAGLRLLARAGQTGAADA